MMPAVRSLSHSRALGRDRARGPVSPRRRGKSCGLSSVTHRAAVARYLDGPALAAESRDFADRWRAFVRRTERGASTGAAAYGVTPRAFDKWVSGEGGPRGDKVAIAVLRHGPAAIRALFPLVTK